MRSTPARRVSTPPGSVRSTQARVRRSWSGSAASPSPERSRASTEAPSSSNLPTTARPTPPAAPVTTAYRLLKFGGFRRILFLVDRNTLAKQTKGEFDNYRIPGDGRRFSELYAVDRLTSAGSLAS